MIYSWVCQGNGGSWGGPFRCWSGQTCVCARWFLVERGSGIHTTQSIIMTGSRKYNPFTVTWLPAVLATKKRKIKKMIESLYMCVLGCVSVLKYTCLIVSLDGKCEGKVLFLCAFLHAKMTHLCNENKGMKWNKNNCSKISIVFIFQKKNTKMCLPWNYNHQHFARIARPSSVSPIWMCLVTAAPCISACHLAKTIMHM